MSTLDRIIVLGDSYTFGHGCSDRIYYYDEDLKKFVGDITPMQQCIPSDYCWPTLLQKEFSNLKIFNLSQPGHCNPGMFRDLSEFYFKNGHKSNDLVIFNGTFPDRIEVKTMYTDDKIGSWSIKWEYMSGGQDFKEYISAQKEYTKHLYHEKIGINLTLSSLFSIHGYTTVNGHNFLYSMPDYLLKTLQRHVEPLSKYNIPPIHNYDFSSENNYQFNITCQAKDTHTNERGHEIYYEKEIKPRIEKFISKQ